MEGWLAKLDPRSHPLSEFNAWYYNRRVFMLSRHLAQAIPNRGTVLDVGCGDGQVAIALMRLRPDLKVEGIDIAPRPSLIPVSRYDGAALPLPDRSVDYVTLIDVLQHTADPTQVLLEAARVARHGVILKDHLREGPLARPALMLTNWLSRTPPPAHFPTRTEWQGLFFRSRLQAVTMVERLSLHLPPATWLLDRHLHFLAYLTPKA